MFENFLTNIKTTKNKVSQSLSYENIRTQTSKFSENLDNIKQKLKSTSANKSYVKDHDDLNNYFSPRAYDNQNSNVDWSFLTDKKLISLEDTLEDSENIVDRFIKVITVNDDREEYDNHRRTDREEIRRRLAMGSESDEYYTPGDRPGRKPSLQTRLQSGMNLQICFMNETVSDSDSPTSDSESTTLPIPKQVSRAPPYHSKSVSSNNKLRPAASVTRSSKTQNGQRPVSLPLTASSQQQQNQTTVKPLSESVTEADFFARQARLQIEARMALAQAKEMAHMQMEVERQRQKQSPITEMVRSSLEKVGIQFPEERRRVSRQILTEMNVAQLQVIVNDLHTQIESLNEGLVKYLMDRDDLHMEQDSMLVDIEDLTRYLGAKEQTVKEHKLMTPQSNNNIPPPSPLMALSSSVKPRLHRIASLVKK